MSETAIELDLEIDMECLADIEVTRTQSVDIELDLETTADLEFLETTIELEESI